VKRLILVALFAAPVLALAQSAPMDIGPARMDSGSSRVLHGTTLPSTCANGDVFVKDNATSGAHWYACEAGSWVAQGGGGSGTVTSFTLAGTANQIAASGTCTITTTGTCTFGFPASVSTNVARRDHEHAHGGDAERSGRLRRCHVLVESLRVLAVLLHADVRGGSERDDRRDRGVLLALHEDHGDQQKPERQHQCESQIAGELLMRAADSNLSPI
jgi:hypothetical protein